MKIFLDTVDPHELEWAQRLGVVSGVTTNPVLVRKAGSTPARILADLASAASASIESISVQLIGKSVAELAADALALRSSSPLFCAKVGFSEAGLELAAVLRREDIPCNVTLLFADVQAILAAALGARYVSIFVSRAEARGCDGLAAVRRFAALARGSPTAVLAASLRTSWHVSQAFEAGADIVTIAPDVLRSMLDHPLTREVREEFERAAMPDWTPLPA
jgi:transaldolase